MIRDVSFGLSGEVRKRRPLRVFLCHASSDKTVVRGLYERLRTRSIRPWLDEKRLLPGQDWDLEIKKAVHNSDVVVVCLSRRSITKEGYVQKEIRFALDVWQLKSRREPFLSYLCGLKSVKSLRACANGIV